MCGPCPEAGTPGRVACLLSLPRLPASLSLTSETVHSLGLKSASQLTQAVDVAHGSWLLAVGERCPGLLAHGGPTTAVGSGESALVTWNLTVVGSNSVVAPGRQGQRWRRHREGAVPQGGGGTTERAVPRRRGGAAQRGRSLRGRRCHSGGGAMEPLKHKRSCRSRLQIQSRTRMVSVASGASRRVRSEPQHVPRQKRASELSERPSLGP